MENYDGVELSVAFGKCKSAPSEATDEAQTGIAGGTLLREDEAVDHRRTRNRDPDSDTLDRLDDCAAVATFLTQEATTVHDKSV